MAQKIFSCLTPFSSLSAGKKRKDNAQNYLTNLLKMMEPLSAPHTAQNISSISSKNVWFRKDDEREASAKINKQN
jgi:hypothetical protein